MKACDEFQILISGYIDHELDPVQTATVKAHLVECAACRKELERLRMLQDALAMMAIRTPEDDFWDGYWAGMYNRLERRVGWVILVLGFSTLVVGGTILLFREILFSHDLPLWVRFGGMGLIAGAAILLLSLIRERMRVNRLERYKDVRR
ncbi:zf-HC2 domain-containing protein [bacterium]|nr:zf-HC2 domain-containing protein [candidate division CSSED10-310 bacterium]